MPSPTPSSPATRSLLRATFFGLLLSLCGCGFDSTIDSGSHAVIPSTEGVVIMGVGLDSGSPTRGDYELGLYRLGAENQLVRPLKHVRVCGSRTVIIPEAYKVTDCTTGTIWYRMVSVPPGRYAMAALLYGDLAILRKPILATNFVSTASKPTIVAHAASGGDIDAHPERSFVVGAGEVVYVGDILFRTSNLPFGFKLTRNDAAAEAALVDYPNVHGTFLFRPLLGPVGQQQ